MSLFGLFGGADSDSDETETVNKTVETPASDEKEENNEEENEEEEEHGMYYVKFQKTNIF